MNRETIQKLTLAGVLAATAVLLSGISFPIGPTRIFPFQHMVNAIAGVLLGPWWAAGAALVASMIRNAMGTGTIFAFPGSLPGALVVGFASRLPVFRRRQHWAALLEPIGTGPIGASLSAYIIGPAFGKAAGFSLILPAFLAASIPGACLGFALLWTAKRIKKLP